MTPCRYVSSNVHVFTCQKSVCRMWVEHQCHGLPSTEPSLPAFLLAAYNKSFSFPRIPNEFSIKKFLVNHLYQHNLSLFPAPTFHFLFLGSSSQAQCELWPLSVSFRNVIFSRTFSVPFFRCVDSLEQHRTKDFHLQSLLMYGYHTKKVIRPNRPDGHCQVALSILLLAGNSANTPMHAEVDIGSAGQEICPIFNRL